MNKNNKIIAVVSALISVLFLLYSLPTMLKSCANHFSTGTTGRYTEKGSDREKAQENAEKYVNSTVYNQLGIVPEKLTSKQFYTEQDGQITRYLIIVKYYLDSNGNPDGSVCVYCSEYTVYNSTTIMPPDFLWEDHKQEVMALFGM